MGTGQAVGISPQRDQLPRQVALDPAEPGGNRRCPVVETDKIFGVALAQHDVNDDHAVFVFEQVILGDKRHPRPDLQPPGFETDEQLIAIGVAGLVQCGVVKRDLDLAAIALLDRDVLHQLKIVPAGQCFLFAFRQDVRVSNDIPAVIEADDVEFDGVAKFELDAGSGNRDREFQRKAFGKRCLASGHVGDGRGVTVFQSEDLALAQLQIEIVASRKRRLGLVTENAAPVELHLQAVGAFGGIEDFVDRNDAGYGDLITFPQFAGDAGGRARCRRALGEVRRNLADLVVDTAAQPA
jgi:hypothetical protein